MATKLKNHEFVGRGRGNGSKYDEYLDGAIYKLELGVDCPLKSAQARSTLAGRAKRLGKKIKTDAITFDGYLVVQAIDVEAATEA